MASAMSCHAVGQQPGQEGTQDGCDAGTARAERQGAVGDGIGIAVRKGDKENLDRINAAITAIRANGKYKAVNDKYFDFDAFGE